MPQSPFAHQLASLHLRFLEDVKNYLPARTHISNHYHSPKPKVNPLDLSREWAALASLSTAIPTLNAMPRIHKHGGLFLLIRSSYKSYHAILLYPIPAEWSNLRTAKKMKPVSALTPVSAASSASAHTYDVRVSNKIYVYGSALAKNAGIATGDVLVLDGEVSEFRSGVAYLPLDRDHASQGPGRT
ncbi:hypothetical protein F5Y19DRAFT_488850 [Xylariaceae sp. FL1651]|nr:hypothetical protein F5Y19DRAFT_488850 [Xylariaceae sp. FL1651]